MAIPNRGKDGDFSFVRDSTSTEICLSGVRVQTVFHVAATEAKFGSAARTTEVFALR